jgi:hypothetical protein
LDLYYKWRHLIWDLGFGIWDLGFGIWDLGFGIWDLGFGIWVKSAFPGALLDVEKFMKKLQEKG